MRAAQCALRAGARYKGQGARMRRTALRAKFQETSSKFESISVGAEQAVPEALEG